MNPHFLTRKSEKKHETTKNVSIIITILNVSITSGCFSLKDDTHDSDDTAT